MYLQKKKNNLYNNCIQDCDEAKFGKNKEKT